MRNWSYAYVLLVFSILTNPNQKFKGIFSQNDTPKYDLLMLNVINHQLTDFLFLFSKCHISALSFFHSRSRLPEFQESV